MKIKYYWRIFKKILLALFTTERSLKAIPAFIFAYTTFQISEYYTDQIKKSATTMLFFNKHELELFCLCLLLVIFTYLAVYKTSLQNPNNIFGWLLITLYMYMSFYLIHLLKKFIYLVQDFTHVSLNYQLIFLSLVTVVAKCTTLTVEFVFFYRLITFLTSRKSIN